MDIDSFKQDIDELIGEFTQDELTTVADMKRVWLSKKFSYIYEACPSTNLAFFMQSLYAHCIGYMIGTSSLSQRLGGLYCLYFLYETQPFKPPIKVYLSLGELKKLRILVADAKAYDIKVVPALVKRMMERNTFLFGAVDLMESCVTETVNQLQQLQNARIQVAYEKIFGNASFDHHIHLDLGVEVDLDTLKKVSSEYVKVKNVAINELSGISDVQEFKRVSENAKLLGDVMENVAGDWHVQQQTFYGETEFGADGEYGRHVQKQTFDGETESGGDDEYGQELEHLLLEHCQDDEDSQD